MSTTETLSISFPFRDARRAGTWLAGGWQLFRRAPLRLFALLCGLLVTEGLLQLAIPVIGVPVSKWAMGLLGGIFWVILWRLHESDRLQPLASAQQIHGKWLVLGGLAGVQLLAFLLQIVVARFLLGPNAVNLLLFGEMMPVSNWQLGVIFAAGVPVSTLLMFAAPLLLLESVSLGEALSGSVRMVVSNAAAMVLLMLLVMVLVALAPLTFALSVLLSGPWLLCVGLIAYLDIMRVSARKE